MRFSCNSRTFRSGETYIQNNMNAPETYEPGEITANNDRIYTELFEEGIRAHL